MLEPSQESMKAISKCDEVFYGQTELKEFTDKERIETYVLLTDEQKEE